MDVEELKASPRHATPAPYEVYIKPEDIYICTLFALYCLHVADRQMETCTYIKEGLRPKHIYKYYNIQEKYALKYILKSSSSIRRLTTC